MASFAVAWNVGSGLKAILLSSKESLIQILTNIPVDSQSADG